MLPWICASIGVLVGFALSFRMLFDRWEDFFDALGGFFTPEILSAARGSWHEDLNGTFKIVILALIMIAVGYAGYRVAGYLPWGH